MEQQERLMKRQKEKFLLLEKDLQEGDISEGDDASLVRRKYDAPQIRRYTSEGYEEWVYKPYTEINCSQAIYLYFDGGKLMEYRYRE